MTSHIKSVVLTADSAFALTEQINSHLDEDDWRVYSFDTTCVQVHDFDGPSQSKVMFSVLLVLEVE